MPELKCLACHLPPETGNGIVLSWGRGEDGQLGHGDAEERARPQAITHLMGAQCSAVYSGAEYSVAVSSANDQVYSWGWCVAAFLMALVSHLARCGCGPVMVHACMHAYMHMQILAAGSCSLYLQSTFMHACRPCCVFRRYI